MGAFVCLFVVRGLTYLPNAARDRRGNACLFSLPKALLSVFQRLPNEQENRNRAISILEFLWILGPSCAVPKEVVTFVMRPP